MQTKIKVSNLVEGNNYWCVYSIRQACQLLLVKFLNKVSENTCEFVILENEDDELKETYPLKTAIVDGEVSYPALKDGASTEVASATSITKLKI